MCVFVHAPLLTTERTPVCDKAGQCKKKWRAGETHVHPKQVQPRGGGGEKEEGALVVCIPINQTARLLLRVLGEPLTSACKHIAGASWSPAFPEQTKTRLVQRAQHH